MNKKAIAEKPNEKNCPYSKICDQIRFYMEDNGVFINEIDGGDMKKEMFKEILNCCIEDLCAMKRYKNE